MPQWPAITTDGTPGDTNGQGVDGIWWVVDPGGAKITEAPPTRGYDY